MSAVYIYGLYEPDTGALRYIGKSIRPFERLRNHINDKSRCHRTNWIRSLVARGLEPDIAIIEEIRGEWPWQESERHWIAYAKKHGANLVNETSGGDGVSNLSDDARAKMKRTWTGRKHSADSLVRIGNAARGRKHTEEHKTKMSTIMSGRVVTWGEKLSAALRKISAEQHKQIQERLAAGETGISLAREYGVHRTTLSKIKMGTYYVK